MARKSKSPKRATNKREKAREVQKQLKSGQLPKNISKTYLLRQMKYSLSKSEADAILESVDDDLFDYITAFPIAQSYASLMKDVGPYVKNLKRELQWIGRFLVDYREELNSFVIQERNYQRYLLLGNYTEARNTLDNIEESISFSAWSMQQKLFVAELEKGFPGNKDLLSGILSEDISSVTSFIANYTSIRVEKNISATQYDEFVDNYTLNLDPEIAQYAYFKVDFFKSFLYSDPELILHVDGRLSIIDRYITFKQLLKMFLSEWDSSTNDDFIDWKHTALKLNGLIDDPDLRLICNTLGTFQQVSENDEQFLKLLDEYSSNNYNGVILIAEEFLITDPKSYHVILLYCKSLLNMKLKQKIFNPNGSILDQVIGSLYQLLGKNLEFSDEVYANIFKISHQLGNHPLAIGLYNQLNEEIPFRLKAYREINFFKMYLLNSTCNNPALNQFLDKQNQRVFLDCFVKEYGESSTVKLIEKISENKVGSDLLAFSIRELKYYAVILRNDKRYAQALDVYDVILSSSEYQSFTHSSHIVLDILIGKFSCLVECNRLMEALDIAVAAIIGNKHFVERFYNPYLLKRLIDTQDQALQANICLPLYLAFYKSIIESYDLYVAYDNYLAILGYETPKDLIASYESYDERDLIFLKIVCSHDVLHSSPYFENQEELDLERLEICNFLLDKLPPYDELEAEISDLLRKILVRKGIKHINYSKIYVDVVGLTDTLQKELKENFNRNVEIAALPIDQLNKIIDSVGSMLVYYVDDPDEDKELTEEDINKVKFTSYNRFLHFSEAFLKVRDKFIFDKDHGLDTYLSMRIRHGTLLGQIRSVFEMHQLITVRNDIDNGYMPNESWLSKFAEIGESNLENLSNSFNTFSDSIDELAERLKLETIQIITEKTKTGNGLFDFSYDQKALLELFTNRFGSIKDYDLFISQVIEELWKRTERCLQAIKNHLSEVLVPKIESVFENLEKNIVDIRECSGHQSDASFQELINTIRDCRTAIVVEIGNISEWFNRSTKKIIEEFDLSVLAESSVNTLQSINPLFKGASITFENTCPIIFDGDLFQHFTHILYYLLDNAIKHSKLASEDLWIKIEISQQYDKITLSVKNNLLFDDAYLEMIRNEIIATRLKIEDEVTYDRINKEGGTGFPKIKKTIKHDLKRNDFSIGIDLEMLNEYTPVFVCTIIFDINGLPIIK